MKVLKKPNAVKRVFVSIRDQNKNEPAKLLIQPKPPNQPPRFIRKTRDSLRCQTPDQNIPKCDKSLSGGKFTYHRSLSPYVPPKDNSYSVFYIPLGTENLLTIPIQEKDEGQCLPYELNEDLKIQVFDFSEKTEETKFSESEKIEPNENQIIREKPAFTRKSVNFDKSVIFENSPDISKRKERDKGGSIEKSGEKNDSTEKVDCKRSKRASIRSLGKNLDISKKVLTKAQLILSHPSDPKPKHERISILHDENSTITSQTPSPGTSHRNNRCQALSKNFKINKQGFANEVEKQVRVKSTEKDSETPWLSILKDLDNIVQIKDLRSYQNFNERPRTGAKLRRG